MKRRELNLFYEYGTAPTNQAASEKVLFREVLPDDPDPEWVDELIAILERTLTQMKQYNAAVDSRTDCNVSSGTITLWSDRIAKHLTKRGTK